MTTTPAPENCWDLTPLYASAHDPAWENDLQGALSAAQAFAVDRGGELRGLRDIRILLLAARADRDAVSDQPHAFSRLFDNVSMSRKQLLELLRVLQRDRGMAGQLDQRLLIVEGKVSRQFVDDFKCAKKFSFATP